MIRTSMGEAAALAAGGVACATLSRTGHHTLVLLVVGLLASFVNGQEREDVQFQITHDTGFPSVSVFVLGDLPELGGGDLTRAVKLVAGEAFLWKVTISLPVNRTYTYRYYDRVHTAGSIGDPGNGIPIGDPVTTSTSTVQLVPIAKKLYYHSTFDPPTLHWRQTDTGPYATLVMQEIGAGPNPGELRWLACGFGEARRPIEFYLTNADETLRDPSDPAETYLTPLDAFFLQDSHLFTYVPASTVSPQRQLIPPAIHSNHLPELRPYRVMLPRGYDEHTDRHYPVMYFHDGDNIWQAQPDSGQGPLDGDGATAAELTRLGQMREIIMVAIDVPYDTDICERRQTRIRDYFPMGDSGTPGGNCGGPVDGEAENYVDFIRFELKPQIDADYRTLTAPENTGTAGGSAAGMISLFLGWDYNDVFKRIAFWSGFIFVLDNFEARVMAEPWREIRIYQDMGTLEGAINYQRDLDLRDNLLGKSPEHWVVEGDHRYFVAFGQDHNYANFGTRLPNAMTFLFPGTEEPNELLCAADLDCDANVGIVDFLALLAAWGPNPGHPADIDGDGTVGIVDFLTLLANWGPCP